MHVYKVIKLLNISNIGYFCLFSNHSSSVSVCGDVSETSVSLWLPVACGEHLVI